MEYSILIVEDDKDISNILKLYLGNNGYHIFCAYDGEEALKLFEENTINLMILDLMLPKIDGYHVLQKVREKSNLPVLILSAKILDNDKILGLNLGADDYMVKPFNSLEVVAKVQSLLRRCYVFDSKENEKHKITCGIFTLDLENYFLYKNEEKIIMTPNEFKILTLLMKSPNKVFTKEQICRAMNGEYYDNYESVINVHILHIREKIEEDAKNPEYVCTVRGIGYRFVYEKK